MGHLGVDVGERDGGALSSAGVCCRHDAFGIDRFWQPYPRVSTIPPYSAGGEAVALVVGPILGAPISWFPLYLGPAVVVEVLALTPLLKRPIVFGAVCGLGIGTVGIWLESFWIDAVYHYPWPASMWPEALVMAVPVAVFMGVCGALLGLVLTGRPLPRPAVGITAVPPPSI